MLYVIRRIAIYAYAIQIASQVLDRSRGPGFEVFHSSSVAALGKGLALGGYVLSVDQDAGVIGYVTLEVVDLTQIEAIQYDWADATVRSVRGGWAVIREDGHVLKAGFPTEAAATEWLGAKRQLAAAGKVA